MAFVIYILFISFLVFSVSDIPDKLIFAVIHFRHGARAPQAIDNNYLDVFGEKWTNPGELTGMGQRMHYILGLRNRIRYITQQKFLSEKFDPHEILIYSSSFNRTLVSASSNLQGLYPQIAEKGEVLTEAQEKMSYPQVDVKCNEIDKEIERLNRKALPDYMMITPVKMINHNERKIIIFDIPGCTEEREEVKKKNRESLQIIKDFQKDFNEKYGERLNKFFGTNNTEYEFPYINSICDAFISAYTDTRELTEFKKSGIDFNEFQEYCLEYNKINFLYHFCGDEEKSIPHLETSKLMGEFIHYMKKRIDADINGEKIEENHKDYSRPKMVILSGHDSTLSSHEVLLMDALGYNSSFYRFPKFAAQMAFEVTRKDDGKKKNDYSDYYINYYFNDEHMFNMTVKEFIEKVEPQLWSSEKINEFCGFDEGKNKKVINSNSDNNNINNNNNNDNNINNNNVVKKKDKAKKAYKALMIFFIALTGALLITTIFLGCLLSRKNNNHGIKNII